MLLRYHFAFLDRICHVTWVDSRDKMSRYSPEARLHVVSCYNCDLALEFNDFMHFSVWQSFWSKVKEIIIIIIIIIIIKTNNAFQWGPLRRGLVEGWNVEWIFLQVGKSMYPKACFKKKNLKFFRNFLELSQDILCFPEAHSHFPGFYCLKSA